MQQLEIGGRIFRDIDSYNRAKKDHVNIEKIKETLDMTDISSVKSVIEKIENKQIRFSSLLGDDFLEELEDCLMVLERQEASKKVVDSRKSIGFKREVLKEQIAQKNKAELNARYGDVKDFKRIRDKSIDANRTVHIVESKTEIDPLLQEEIRKAIKRKEFKRKFMIVCSGLVCLGCIAYLIFYFTLYFKNGAEYDALAELINEEAPKETVYKVNLVDEKLDTPPVLAKYETLYQKNKKIVGWLKIEGTNIDYPVMQTVNNEYYLDHNYNQEYDKNGSLFMDKDCDAAHPNDNMIIYGHHMKSGKMFGQLNYYAKEEFYKEHPSFMFDTIYEEGTYDVMYVFRSKIYNEEDVVFKYYKFLDATSEAEFDSNMEEMSQISLYDTGIKAHYGDKLLTLSTCDNSESNGRFVVVAKKVK